MEIFLSHDLEWRKSETQYYIPLRTDERYHELEERSLLKLRMYLTSHKEVPVKIWYKKYSNISGTEDFVASAPILGIFLSFGSSLVPKPPRATLVEWT